MPKRRAPKGCFWREGVLWGRAQVRGRDFKWSLRTDDPKVARSRRKAGRDRLVAAGIYGDARLTFAEVYEAWSSWIVSQVSASTVERYASSLGTLEPYLDGKYLDEVNGSLVAEIIRKRQAEGVTNATIKRDLGALSSVMNFAIDQGWLEANPVLPRMQRLKERRDPIVLPEHNHIALVIELAPGRWPHLIRAAIATGAREDELVRAKRGQHDAGRRQLTVIGKRNKLRVIDLEPFGGSDVFKSIPVFLQCQWLFWHGEGERYKNPSSNFSAIVKRVAAWAKSEKVDFRPFTFHHLRHRHAVDWLKSGRSIYDLQHRLGHTSIKTTEVYLKFLTPEEVRIVKRQQRPEQKPEQSPRTGTTQSS